MFGLGRIQLTPAKPSSGNVWPWLGKRPHRCPVCEGRGWVFDHLYTALPTSRTTQCRSCAGKGVLWG